MRADLEVETGEQERQLLVFGSGYSCSCFFSFPFLLPPLFLRCYRFVVKLEIKHTFFFIFLSGYLDPYLLWGARI